MDNCVVGGVFDKYALYPLVYSLYSWENVLEWPLLDEEGMDLGTVKGCGLAFADGKVFTTEPDDDLQRIFNRLNTSMKNIES